MTKSKKKKPQTTNKNTMVKKVGSIHSMSTGLSACATHYAKVMINPFGQFTTLPCLPVSPALPSRKFKCNTRGTMSCGSSGYGFIVMNSATLISDIAAVYATSSDFAGSNFTGLATGITSSMLSLPYTSTSHGSVRGRVVGAGLRLRYVGTELERGGLLRGVCLSKTPAILGIGSEPQAPISVISQYEYSWSAPMDRRWHSVTYRPFSDDQLLYQELQNDGSAARKGVNLVLTVSGNTKATFEYELVTFVEYQQSGELKDNTQTLMPNVTRSHADPVGVGMILDSVQESGLSNSSSTLKRISNFTSDLFSYENVSSGVIQSAQLVGTAIGASVKGLVSGLQSSTRKSLGDAINH